MSAFIRLRYLPGYKLEILSNNEFFIDHFKEYLTIYEQYVTRPKKGRLQFRTKAVRLFSSRKSCKNSITVDAGIFEYIAVKLAVLNRDSQYPDRGVPEFHLEIENQDLTFEVCVSQEWRQIFRTNPKGVYAGALQEETVNRLSRYRGGIAQLHTGAGKTEIICSLSDSVDVPVIITAPQNPIVDEIYLRFERYGVEDVGIEDWEKKIVILNPKGFINSSRAKDPAALKRLSEAKMIILDEVHHSSSKSYDTFFNLLSCVERSYGFSASPDSDSGKDLSTTHTPLGQLSSKVIKVIGKSGLSRIKRSLPIEVSVVKVSAKLSETYIKDSDDSDDSENVWLRVLDKSLQSSDFVDVICNILRQYPERLFFIPVHKKDSGIQLHRSIASRGIPGFYWDSSVFESSVIETNCSGAPLDILKAKLKAGSCYRYLMSTSLAFEGVDIPALSAVIPLTGSNFRTVIQPCGRAARSTDLLVFLIFDKNNPVLMRQSDRRLETIQRELNVIHVHNIDLDG